MKDRNQVKEQLSGKRVYSSDGVPIGKAMLIAECGRVMAVEDTSDIPPDVLQLVDTVCINRNDPLNPR